MKNQIRTTTTPIKSLASDSGNRDSSVFFKNQWPYLVIHSLILGIFLLCISAAQAITIEDLSRKLTPQQLENLHQHTSTKVIINSKRGIFAAIQTSHQFSAFIRDVYCYEMKDEDGIVYIVSYNRNTDNDSYPTTFIDNLSLDPLVHGIVFKDGIPLFPDLRLALASEAYTDMGRKKDRNKVMATLQNCLFAQTLRYEKNFILGISKICLR